MMSKLADCLFRRVRPWRRIVIVLLLSMPPGAWACTVGGTTATDLGSVSSLQVAGQVYETSFSGGLSCGVGAVMADNYYTKVKVESTSTLMGVGGQQIPFQILSASNGTVVHAGDEYDFSSWGLLTIFAGINNSVPLYVRILPQAGLPAGTYTGTVELRWYYSICENVGAFGACLMGFSQSTGFDRGANFSWGTGDPVTLTLSLRIENDCAITAPDLDFGTVPLVAGFMPVTQALSIRCSAGAAYSVGMSDGDHYDGVSRRMRSAAGDYLRYELFKSVGANDRWGSASGERRDSGTAEVNPGIYDGLAVQSYTYRGVVDAAQPTPPTGTYSDNVIVDVQF